MKEYDYIIVLKRSGHGLVDRISRLMLCLALIVFGASVLTLGLSQKSLLLLVIIGGIIGWWVYCYLQQKKGFQPFYRIALLMAAVGWAVQAGWGLIPAIYFLAAILEKQVKFPQEIAFDADEIVINSFPKKHFHWRQLQNVLLKDGILTIDFHNNKLIQKEIETPVSAGIEQEFNGFCRERLNAESIMLKAQS